MPDWEELSEHKVRLTGSSVTRVRLVTGFETYRLMRSGKASLTVQVLFVLTIHHVPGAGFSGHAYEVTSAPDGGYIFRSFAEASFTTALARLRGKIRAGLAQRFLIHDGDALDMPLERLCGRIDCDGVVVDGRLLDWTALQSLLQTYEGWEFELRIPFEDR